MKITIEIDVDDSVKRGPNPGQLNWLMSSVCSYAQAYVQTAEVKAGRVEEHNTGVFGSVYKFANNVKITMDRTQPVEKRGPYKVYVCHSFVGRNSSLNCYGAAVAPDAATAASLLDMQLYAEGIDQPRAVTSRDMIEVHTHLPKAYVVKDE